MFQIVYGEQQIKSNHPLQNIGLCTQCTYTHTTHLIYTPKDGQIHPETRRHTYRLMVNFKCQNVAPGCNTLVVSGRV